MEKAVLDLAKRKLGYGTPVKVVNLQTGVPVAILYQLKREVKVNNFGCIVCGMERKIKNYCRKHYFRYK